MTTKRRESPASAEKTGDRTRRIVISDESVDRYNTTFAADGWETRNFEKNPVLLKFHSSSDLPLGKVTELERSGKKLLGTAEFFADDVSPDASRVLKMIDAGVLAVSHRFEPIEEEYNAEREKGDWHDWLYPPIDYKRQELLEVSIVTVPGNANALPLRNFTDPEDLRLLAQAALTRAAASEYQGPVGPELERLTKMRAAAHAKRSAPEEKKPEVPPAPAPEPTPEPEPAPEEKSEDEQEVELPEGMDANGVAQLVKDTVAEVLEQRGRSAALRRRGELEVA